MKQFKLLQLLVFATILIFGTSCKKDDDNKETTEHERKASVTALVDGDDWQASPHGPHSPISATATRNTDLNIIIQAYASDGSYIALNVVSTSGIVVNTNYTAESAFFQGQFKPDYLESDLYTTVIEGGTGTLKFTNISESNVSGTFSFNGLKPDGGSVAVDNGSFDVDL